MDVVLTIPERIVHRRFRFCTDGLLRRFRSSRTRPGKARRYRSQTTSLLEDSVDMLVPYPQTSSYILRGHAFCCKSPYRRRFGFACATLCHMLLILLHYYYRIVTRDEIKGREKEEGRIDIPDSSMI